MRTSLTYRREVADKALLYLKGKGITTCGDTSKMLDEVSVAIGEEKFNLWKGFELLRMMGRVEYNNPNGRRGFKVFDYSPLVLGIPDRPSSSAFCDVNTCPVVKTLKKKFPNLCEAAK